MKASMYNSRNGIGNLEDLKFQINMFGGLSIKVGDIVMKDSASRSYQLWNLLEYLIAFRHKTIAPEEMYDALWGQDDIENPASALKNLIYRIRSVFTGYGIPFAKNIIVYSGGTYRWNNVIPCVVDIEEFEDLHKRASNPSQPMEYRIENYLKAIELYKGDFLAVSNHKNWVAPVSSYYRSMYFKCVEDALALLVEQERYQEVEMICKMALIVDQYEEATHKYLILALSKQGQQNKAISHYKFVADLFLRELGVQPSASLRNLYRQITKTANNVEIDIGIIQQDLKETESADGAFYCEYEVFKNIYQVLSRTAPRSGHSIFVALCTITNGNGEMPEVDIRKKSMDGLFRVIRIGTRRCDVFARFSVSQYVLLLPTTSIENCELILKRITILYKKNYNLPNITLNTKIQPLDYSGM